MRVTLRSGLLAVLALALAACGAAASGSQAQSTAGNAGGSSSGPTPELTETTRLMLGTLKLKDVGLQPDATQATQLVTLWQAYQSVASSDSAVAAEAEAVLKEIRATMTPEQLASIAAMALTQEDLQGFVDEFRQTASPSGGTSRSAMTPGQGPGGGPGPGFTGIVGGEGFAGEGSVPPEPMATVQPGSVGNGSDASGTGLLLIQPLIAELQELAGT